MEDAGGTSGSKQDGDGVGDGTGGGEEVDELNGVKVAIIGLGASGRAAARLALQKGGEVYVSDLRVDAQAAAGGAELRALGAHVEQGGHDVERMAPLDPVPVSARHLEDNYVLDTPKGHLRARQCLIRAMGHPSCSIDSY